MIILQDSREKSALSFNHPEVTETRICKLDVGDYTAIFEDNTMPGVYFERKGLGDLWGSLTKDYSRIKEEIERARTAGVTLIIIIEGNLSKVFKGYRHSKVAGVSIIKTLFSLWARYNIIPIFVKDRREMEEYIVHYFWAVWRKKISKENA